MPELPEVTALAAFLDGRLAGATLDRVYFPAFHALKTADPPYTELVGRQVESVGRRGKYVVLTVSPASAEGAGADDGAGRLHVVVHLALGGWVRVLDKLPDPAPPRGKGYVAARFGFVRGEQTTGVDLTEAGTWKRLAVWIVRRLEDIPPIAELGPEPLEDEFTLEKFRSLLNKRQQIKGLLRNQKIIAGIGNAYSDEILHVAKLSPFAVASTLDDEETARLYTALRETLEGATAEAVGRPPEDLKDEKRASMRVHRRTGEACPVCGDTIREVTFSDSALQYCPTCQTGGKILADRTTSKFLK
ncbi:DNA-formamidopyrimidine glycosylase family protein [Sinomonas sp. JGH33]|uniref:DNA-formamidopyrimidine glycosylase family protein n=1 Tax=Sinomonas terricola TaxID=3110330 RepID=A0ABU5TAY0_9MICC|nr:DNA-formamidopyrimidine glycosylase family protein [Sinomonas sp. JGH33]MEA5456855.1 DNA-formamidopyrimidine glycosylase family protein [Sinomonas sp. JGH33]